MMRQEAVKFSRGMEAIQAHDMRQKGAKAPTTVTLGVKGKLTNQEMEILRQQLAKATAYDHTPPDKAATRQQNIKRPPKFIKATKSGVHDQVIPIMTVAPRPGIYLLYRIRRNCYYGSWSHRNGSYIRRLAKKPAAAIQTQVATLNRCEPLYVPRTTKGINQLDKDRLQDEYTTKPRKLRCAPFFPPS
ncbi:hypothetical protein AaE_007213 [Aphanomyces astaci]|uniref:Uncharacterized protein n=1 Tax=Aphanomyces astaci TaxID=112090 RepID=A0A6A4ZY50_APHAT|nr:hypothetical protein AaE_007213 [Aphanomyces astaci]